MRTFDRAFYPIPGTALGAPAQGHFFDTSKMNSLQKILTSLALCASLAACGGGGSSGGGIEPLMPSGAGTASTAAQGDGATTSGSPGNAGTTGNNGHAGAPVGNDPDATNPNPPLGADLTQNNGMPGFGSQWNEQTIFNVVNKTNGRWSDSEIYWTIIGKDWSTHQFVHVDAKGRLIPMSMTDNGALEKNGRSFTNYFFRLSDTKAIAVPPIDSARLFVSMGSPMYIEVNRDVNGNIGYAGADLSNPTDPNLDVYFDFIELASPSKGTDVQGIFANTSRVDQFGFPLQMRLEGLGGYDRTVGEPLMESRDQIFARFQTDLPTAFKSLASAPYAPYRIIAPAHASFQEGGSNGKYLDDYIESIWSKYAQQDLIFSLSDLGTFTGRVDNGKFVFRGGKDNGIYFINAKPSTQMTLFGDGVLNDATGGASDISTQLQIQAQMCAALNRRVVEDTLHWYDQSKQYPADSASNWYAKFWHDHGIDALAYGFAYDDVGNLSSSLRSDAPTELTLAVGW